MTSGSQISTNTASTRRTESHLRGQLRLAHFKKKRQFENDSGIISICE